MKNTGKLLVIMIISLLSTFDGLEALGKVSNSTKISCEESNKKDLFQSLMKAYEGNDNNEYGHIVECLGRLEVDDSEYIWVFYQVIFSENDIYARKVVELISDVNILLPTNENMIIYAVEAGSLDLVRDLLKRGAKTNVRSFGNLTPIEIAVGKSLELFELVLENTKLSDCELKSLVSNLIFSGTPKRAKMFEMLLNSLPEDRRNSLISGLKKNKSDSLPKSIEAVLKGYGN